MGIESPYIGLYGIWSMVGIEVGGMAEAGCYWGVVWVGQWGYWSGSMGLLEWVVGVGQWGYWSGWLEWVVGVGGWRFRVFRIRTATLFCARILRDSTPKNRVR